MGRGFNTRGDVLTKTIDGYPLEAMYTEYKATLDLVNKQRTPISALFTVDTTQSSDSVTQTSDNETFEKASEFGEPKAFRPNVTPLTLGYDLDFYDMAARYTEKFMRDATRAQVDSVHNGILAANDRTVFQKTMAALTSKVTNGLRSLNKEGVPIYDLWDGTDDDAPPPYAGQTFQPTHSHYLVSGAAAVDGGDLRDLVRTITEHGYGVNGGERVIVLVNPQEGEIIRSFRAGVASSPYDFIPSASAPAFITAEHVIGSTPPDNLNGLAIIGSYGHALISESYFIPAGYLVAGATSGANSQRNPLGFRMHVRPEYQGLRIVPGLGNGHPLIDSVYSTGFGLGVRHRGAAAIMQIKASGSYDNPVWVQQTPWVPLLAGTPAPKVLPNRPGQPFNPGPLEAIMFTSSDPSITAEADQLLAAIEEGRRRAPHNRNLVNDPLIDQLIRFACKGQWTLEDELASVLNAEGAYPAPRPLLISGDWNQTYGGATFARAVPDDNHPFLDDILAPCCYCGDGAKAGYRLLWLNVGRLILEFAFCKDCSESVDSAYGPIIWKR